MRDDRTGKPVFLCVETPTLGKRKMTTTVECSIMRES